MVKLRLTRTGKKHSPHYRIIAIQNRTKRDGKALAYLGYYNPRSNPSTVNVKKEEIEKWLANGAQPTDTVRRILIKEGIIEAPKDKIKFTKNPGRKNKERAELAASEAAEKVEAKAAEAAEAKEKAETKAEKKKEESK